MILTGKVCSFFNTRFCLVKFTQKHVTCRGQSKKQAARDNRDCETKERSGKWTPWLRKGKGLGDK